jgi:hypothetical protein
LLGDFLCAPLAPTESIASCVMKSVASAALVFAALANAVPSTSALHPAIARLGIKEADLTAWV